MAKWNFSVPLWTPTAVGDTATMTANGAAFLQPGSATQLIKTSELFVSGQASTSNVMPLILARDSTNAATALGLGTQGRNAPLSPFTAALAAPPVPGMTATTMPQRSATLYLLTAALQAFGGIWRWVAYPGEEITQYGTAVNVGELSLSMSNVGGTAAGLSSTWVYEPD